MLGQVTLRKADCIRLNMVEKGELFRKLGKDMSQGRAVIGGQVSRACEKAEESRLADMKDILDLHLVLEKNEWKKHLRQLGQEMMTNQNRKWGDWVRWLRLGSSLNNL